MQINLEDGSTIEQVPPPGICEACRYDRSVWIAAGGLVAVVCDHTHTAALLDRRQHSLIWIAWRPVTREQFARLVLEMDELSSGLVAKLRQGAH